MIDLQGFVFAMIPIALSPGASFTLAISNASASGARGAFKVIVGTGLGILVHGSLVGAGFSSFIVKNVILLNTLKLVGIIFLFYIGVRLLILGLEFRNGSFNELKETSIKEAFLLNIFNAKALLFYVTVVPIFAGIEFSTYLYLSVLHVLVMSVWTAICSYIFFLAKERGDFSKVSMVVNIIAGMCLVYFSYVSAVSFNN
ncbi:LysE family translocator [Photobacterium sp. GJ3]|uniref:LysE family translocator n=1 Tax=Photobacterium sp. GJ3 TaxID=2829502 RepID=UPI001B8CFABD|nr:LysE family translocator [Photobacterium sp. GJ3]QUJ66197.1 LysE family translocator [Photobacterium sp. GJ3]